MFNNQDLLKLWSNNEKRRAFVQGFKAWGVWFKQPELNQTFYKYDLPGGGRIVAMEYLREPYPSEKLADGKKFVVNHKFYLQSGEYFKPDSVSDSFIADKLKGLKVKLANGLSDGAAYV